MITKLLVANRGEIAARIMRTARELDIATVAVFSDPDAGMPYVRLADEAVRLPGSAPADTYLRGDLLVAAAARTGADAVHPGYGFLSENAGFARAVTGAGLTWVGPPPDAIEAMGSKIAAKRLMAAAGVPVLPGITIGAAAAGAGSDGPDGAGFAARVGTEIGYPVLVKAAFGGGGRGMRVVRDEAELADAVASAQREAAAAFGDGTVFLERYVDAPRHIEVQIFGDRYGTVVHLFERECSVQRRYQKIIEEAPSPAVDEALRAELGAAAVAAGKAIGYVGAGTVEFVLGADGRFHFLEVNTRLQVEHPVTELVTGLDLVRLQLLVAEGQPLPAEVLDASITGHAVEARLYAEDVPAGFLPATGPVHEFTVPALAGVRVDAGVAAGTAVGVHYDPMLAKVIAHAPTRDEACRRLARALAETRVHGVVTNRGLLAGILREADFRAGRIDTGYLTRHDPALLARSWAAPETDRIHAVAAALAGQAERRAAAPVAGTLPSGWRNVPSAPQRVTFGRDDGPDLAVAYQFAGFGAPGGPGAVSAEVNGEPLPGLVLLSAGPALVRLAVSGVQRDVSVHRVGDVFYLDSSLGASALAERPRFPDPAASAAPGSLLAPMPGTVLRVGAAAGAAVRAGTPVVVLEAMKMEHTVAAPHDGVLADVLVRAGQQVDTGTVLAVVTEDGGAADGAQGGGTTARLEPEESR